MAKPESTAAHVSAVIGHEMLQHLQWGEGEKETERQGERQTQR